MEIKIIFDYYQMRIDTSLTKDVRILILNTPCNGFGDLIFAYKLAVFLRENFKCVVNIASTQPDKLLMLGENDSNIRNLQTRTSVQCRRFKHLSLDDKDYDLFFVAPLNQDFDVNRSDVKKLIPTSNRYNTFVFSEYQDDLYKDIDFPTGVGKDYMGIFINKYKIEKYKHPVPYAFSYIAAGDGYSHIPMWRNCITSFIQLVCKKNHAFKEFDIIGTEVTLGYISKLSKRKLNALYGKYYGTIVYQSKTEVKEIYISDNTGVLTLRADIFPVPHKKILSLMKYSVDDILLTGDQSLSDGLSCCPNKNIWYQTVPWKTEFISQLASDMPNKYLARAKTSCGSLKSTRFKSNYKKFINENNFFVNALPDLYDIILDLYESESESYSDDSIGSYESY